MIPRIQRKSYVEKRTGPDFLVVWIRISSALAWVFMTAFFLIADNAKPQRKIIFDYILNTSKRNYWDPGLLKTAFYLSIFLFFFSLISLFLNTKRLKRKNDRISYSLVIALVVSLVSIILYLVNII